MAARAGRNYASLAEVPSESLPRTAPASLKEAPRGAGSGPGRRRAPDGTAWCATCDTVLDPTTRAHYCPKCRAARRRVSVRRHREPGRRARRVEEDAIAWVLDATHGLEAAVGQLSAKLNKGDIDSRTLENLFDAAKLTIVRVREVLDP